MEQWRRAQCGEVWLSPYLGPAHSGNIHRPMKKVRFTSLTLATATSSVRPSRPRCAPRRRAPDALAQIPAPCSGPLALRPSGPDAPGHLAASPAPCCRLQWRAGAHALRPSSPARRLSGSPCPRRAWVPRRLPGSLQRRGRSRQPPLRLPAAPLRPPVLPPLIPLPLTLSLHPSVTLKSQLQNYSLTAAETREGKAAAGSSSMEQQPSSSRKGKRKAQGRGERSSVFWVLYRIGNLN